MMFYYKSPYKNHTNNLKSLLPHIINPHRLSDQELASYNIYRCNVNTPVINWWQLKGDLVINDTVTPHEISWNVLEKDIETVKSIAWEKIKQMRVDKRTQGVSYMFPGDIEGNIQIRDEDIQNLLALHAAATTAIMMSNDAQLPFTDENNVTHWLNPTEMLQLTMFAFSVGSQIHIISQTLRENIENASLNGVESVVNIVNQGWPE